MRFATMLSIISGFFAPVRERKRKGKLISLGSAQMVIVVDFSAQRGSVASAPNGLAQTATK
jgi:hypothetical protein